MEVNNPLDREVLDQSVFPETGDSITPISFGRGIWMAIQFALIQFAAIIPIALIGFGIYGME